MQVDKTINPDVIDILRSKRQTERLISVIEMKSKAEGNAMASRYGVRVQHNPLFKLSLDIHRYMISLQCMHLKIWGEGEDYRRHNARGA